MAKEKKKKVITEFEADEMLEDVLNHPENAMRAHEVVSKSQSDIKKHPKFDKFKNEGK